MNPEQSEDNIEIVEDVVENTEVTETVDENSEVVAEEKPQSRSQNAKQRLRRKLGESEARNTALADQISQQQERLDALDSKLDGVVNPPAARPSRENFETEEDYEDALYDYRTPKQVETKPVQEQVATQPTQDNVAPEVRKNWDSQLDACGDKYEDFEDVLVSIPYQSMSDTMTEVLMESDKGGEIAYFLGNNHAEASRIAGLSASAQVRELDKLGSKFETTTSSAPDPISEVKGGGDSGLKDMDKMSPEEYRAERRRMKEARK